MAGGFALNPRHADNRAHPEKSFANVLNSGTENCTRYANAEHIATDRKFVTIYDLAYVAPSRAFYDQRTSQQLRARRRRNAPPKPAAPGASHRRATCARAGAAMGLWRASAASSPHRKSNTSERGSRSISFISNYVSYILIPLTKYLNSVSLEQGKLFVAIAGIYNRPVPRSSALISPALWVPIVEFHGHRALEQGASSVRLEGVMGV